MKRLFYILFCLLLWGCQNEEAEKPENMIPEAKMVQILADVHTAEAKVENKIIYPDTALMVFSHEQQQIFEKYDITEEQFRDSYRYYVKNVAAMDQLYETIIDTLNVRETKVKIAEGIDPTEDDELELQR